MFVLSRKPNKIAFRGSCKNVMPRETSLLALVNAAIGDYPATSDILSILGIDLVISGSILIYADLQPMARLNRLRGKLLAADEPGPEFAVWC